MTPPCSCSARAVRTLSAWRTALCVLPALLPLVSHAMALPEGANVASGHVQIERSPGSMTLRQDDEHAVIDWHTFDIGSRARVAVIQPASTSILMNRVTGGAPSTLAGALSANGAVLLVNPNGISITPSGIVETAGFVASTLPIDEADIGSVMNTARQVVGEQPLLLNRDRSPLFHATLTRALAERGERGAAPVVNEGLIRAVNGGVVALLGTSVTHGGHIVASGGRVTMAGTGVADIASVRSSRRMPTLPQPLSRAITVDITGTVQTHSTDGVRGKIVVDGGEGRIRLHGLLDASASSGRGGAVVMTAPQIDVDDAIVDVAGASGGGQIVLRTRGGDVGTQRIEVGVNGALFANADHNGDGGLICLESPGQTVFRGVALARGESMRSFDVLTAHLRGVRGGRVRFVGGKHLVADGYINVNPGPWAESEDFGVVEMMTGGSVRVGAMASAHEAAPSEMPESAISATTVSNALQEGGHVSIENRQRGYAPSTLTVDAPVQWRSNTELTLYGEDHTVIGAPILALGDDARVHLTSGPDGSYAFAGGNIALPGSGSSLSVNGINYSMIRDSEMLQTMMALPAGEGYYALAQSIDLAGRLFEPLDTNAPGYLAHLEGLGNAIHNLRIVAPDRERVGFFRTLGGATVVSNLIFSGAHVVGSRRVGVLAGERLDHSHAIAVQLIDSQATQMHPAPAGVALIDIHMDPMLPGATDSPRQL